MSTYFHGYSQEEYDRLAHQALFLEPEVYPFIQFEQGAHVIEMGCGIGAQTQILLRRNPSIRITAVDRSDEELDLAANFTPKEFQDRVDFVHGDLMDFVSASPGDAAFCCWMLEHASDPLGILKQIRKSLRPGAVIYLTEVQNHSLKLHPESKASMIYWEAYSKLQEEMQGDPFIGLRLDTLLTEAGFKAVQIQAHPMIRNSRNVEATEAMCSYWWRLMESAGDAIERAGYIDANIRREAKNELLNLHKHPEGRFEYAFVQARAIN